MLKIEIQQQLCRLFPCCPSRPPECRTFVPPSFCCDGSLTLSKVPFCNKSLLLWSRVRQYSQAERGYAQYGRRIGQHVMRTTINNFHALHNQPTDTGHWQRQLMYGNLKIGNWPIRPHCYPLARTTVESAGTTHSLSGSPG